MSEIEVVLTAHSAWWLRLVNWLGADMTWTHALLRFDDYIIEAAAEGVVKRPWNPNDWESHGRFRLRGGLPDRAAAKMTAFADGEVGKRYKYEALPLILLRILQRIHRSRVVRRFRSSRIGRQFLGTGEVCTSFVDRVFWYGGFDLVPSEDRPFVLPDDFADSPLLVHIL